MVTLYGYKKCSTCRKAEKALDSVNIDYQFKDITLEPPSTQALKTIATQAQLPINKLFNTSGVQYRELGLKNKLSAMSESQMLQLLAQNGRLVKRPIVTDGKRSTVGFKEDFFTECWQ